VFLGALPIHPLKTHAVGYIVDV